AIQAVPEEGNDLRWQLTPALRWSDPLEGMSLEQSGNVHIEHPLDLDISPGRSVGQSPSLVYNSNQFNVRPILQATLQTDNATTEIPTLTVQLTWDGVEQTATT